MALGSDTNDGHGEKREGLSLQQAHYCTRRTATLAISDAHSWSKVKGRVHGGRFHFMIRRCWFAGARG